jgi:diguanylate cyclase (GGDEF)-like protein/PAS domain S-box-containing protein
MHNLLRRQLRRHAIDPDAPPPGLIELIGAVSEAYESSDADRLLIERSLEMSSRELLGANAELRAAGQLLHATLESTADGIIVANTAGRIVFMNGRFAEFWGFPEDLARGGEAEAILGRVAAQIVDRERMIEKIRRLADNRDEDHDSVTLHDGRTLETYTRPLLDVDSVSGRVWSFRDVTERQVAEQALRRSEGRLRQIAETTPVGIYQMTLDYEVTYLNASACEMFEVNDEQEMNRYDFEQFFSAESLQLMRAEHAKRSSGVASTFEVDVVGRRGTRRDVLVTGAPLNNDRGEVEGVIGTLVDITERKRHELALTHAASHDSLTNAFNRRRFQDEVEREIGRISSEGGSCAVLFLDLDDFKAVNDTFGHPVGDRLLSRIAQTLRSHLRSGDCLARVGGDEFAILLPATDAKGARVVANALLRRLRNHPVEIEGRLIETLVSVGIAMGPAHGLSADELLGRADVAMYQAKERGRNRVCVFSAPSTGQTGAARLKWKHRIREALDKGGLMLYGQPIVNLKTGDVDRYELLLRMTGEGGQLLLPGSFLGIAEGFGLVAEIDAWVVREAIRLVEGQLRQGREMRVAVNLSSRALDDKHILTVIRKELARTAIDPRNIWFEITESAAIANVHKAQRLLTGLADMGCNLSLDDFGVGFSSFSRLKDLPLNELKIDGSFIQNLKDSPVDQHLVRAMVELARGLHMEVVAEFVQDAESVALLHAFGVDYGQGYYFSQPLPFEQLAAGLGRAPDRKAA